MSYKIILQESDHSELRKIDNHISDSMKEKHKVKDINSLYFNDVYNRTHKEDKEILKIKGKTRVSMNNKDDFRDKKQTLFKNLKFLTFFYRTIDLLSSSPEFAPSCLSPTPVESLTIGQSGSFDHPRANFKPFLLKALRFLPNVTRSF